MKRKGVEDISGKRSKKAQRRAPNMTKLVKSMILRNMETKRLEFVDYLTTSANTGWVLGYPQQGTDSDERIGDKISLVGLRMNYGIWNTATTPIHFRVLVFYARSTSLLSAAAIFRGAPANYTHAMVDVNNVQLLHDEVYNIDTIKAQSDFKHFYIPLKLKPITFQSGTTTTSEQPNIQVWVTRSDNTGVPGTGSARFIGYFELQYKDA